MMTAREVILAFVAGINASLRMTKVSGCLDAGGSFKADADKSWRLRAAWKATINDSRVATSQVIADTKIPSEILDRN